MPWTSAAARIRTDGILMDARQQTISHMDDEAWGEVAGVLWSPLPSHRALNLEEVIDFDD